MKRMFYINIVLDQYFDEIELEAISKSDGRKARTDGRIDGQSDGRTDGRMDREMDRRTERWTDWRSDE
jgi:hypothetical protein